MISQNNESPYSKLLSLQEAFRSQTQTVNGREIVKSSKAIPSYQTPLIEPTSKLANELLGAKLLKLHQDTFFAAKNTSQVTERLSATKDAIDYILETLRTIHHNEWDFDASIKALGEQGSQVKTALLQTMGQAWKNIVAS